MMQITLQAADMYSLAKALARGYSHTKDAPVTDEDISVSYGAVCTLPFLYCPAYLISETRALRDKEQA